MRRKAAYVGMMFALALPAGALAKPAAPARSNCSGPVKPVKACVGGVCANGMAIEHRRRWHGLGLCFRELREAMRKGGLNAQVSVGNGRAYPAMDLARNSLINELTKPDVGIWDPSGRKYVPIGNVPIDTKSKVAILNNGGRSFNGMSQMDMANSMVGMVNLPSAKAMDRKTFDLFYKLSRSFINVVIAPVGQGGLMTQSQCRDKSRKCAWFHSVTNMNADPSNSGALNQDLHIIRDLLNLSASSNDLAYLRDYAYSGMAQLFIGAGDTNRAPSFSNFVVKQNDGSRLLYYGFFNKQSKFNGYFLPNKGKNCHYAMHSMNLAYAILTNKNYGDGLVKGQALSCGSPLMQANQTLTAFAGPKRMSSAEMQCAGQGRYEGSPSNSFYNKAFSSCGLAR